jgi:hypothetical protein
MLDLCDELQLTCYDLLSYLQTYAARAICSTIPMICT